MIDRPSKSLAIAAALLLAAAPLTSGCTVLVAGAAAGGGGYETHQHNQMERLDRDYAAGRITQDEYEARKREIQETSLLQ